MTSPERRGSVWRSSRSSRWRQAAGSSVRLPTGQGPAPAPSSTCPWAGSYRIAGRAEGKGGPEAPPRSLRAGRCAVGGARRRGGERVHASLRAEQCAAAHGHSLVRRSETTGRATD
eukprot:GHVT01095130.1.p1 GENE.GHVT01095130.1~~GHVT01095130.1.p1  ORF type:complete len:116 (-),score=25.40 GHVT01095130.1:228-575(-)